MQPAGLIARVRRIRLVLTDGSVPYSERGEETKCFNNRDGIASGIITGEVSPLARTRAAKLQIEESHFGIKDKPSCLREIMARTGLRADEIAFIGDATSFAHAAAGFHCQAMGGHGCFRKLAEFTISRLHRLPFCCLLWQKPVAGS